MFLICRRTRSWLTRSCDGGCVERPSSLLRAFIFPSRLQEVNSQRINIIRKQRKRERRRASVTKKDNTIGDGKQRLTRVRIQLRRTPEFARGCSLLPAGAGRVPVHALQSHGASDNYGHILTAL